MDTTRPPAVADGFYPADPALLAATVDRLLSQVTLPAGPPPKVLIVPHAGYIYSGPTAATAYALLAPLRQQIKRVVLLGPTHRVAVDGLALPACEAFATPLGDIRLDLEAIARLRELPQIVFSNRGHAREHSLEVHLPFLQRLLDEFKLVPLAVGQSTPQAVAEVVDRLWDGPETLIVISTDLSHFKPYEAAQQADRNTCRQILHFATDLAPEQACGAFPLNGLLLTAGRRGLRPELLHLCNSGDTAGDKQRVVGYAAFALREPDHA
ncbi:MAG: amrB [Proteobacteria bacterium]|nr:amrB [Pseudomonadota bacterium]